METKDFWRKYNSSDKRKEYLLNYRKTHQDYYKKYAEDNKEKLREKAIQKKIESGWKPKEDWVYTQNICYKCKSGDKPLMKWCMTKQGNQYFVCRDCNRLRANNYYKTHSTSIYKNVRKSEAKYPEKVSARRKVLWAVKTGQMLKPKNCVVCGRHSDRLQAHHKDYTRPLDVMWLCGTCHANEHRLEKNT